MILHVSRMDEDRAKTAFLLCDVMADLAMLFDVRLVLVGGGTLFQSLSERVAKDRAICERVMLVGEAVDVLPYLAQADVFVGVSRAALEAMACGIPTVLSGNSGYFGIFRSERLFEAAATNFCCRTSEMPTRQRLFHDLRHLLQEGENSAYTARLSEECKRVVKEHYSLERMTQDALTLYRGKIYPRGERRSVILGYHGFGNLGDDLLLSDMVQSIERFDPMSAVTVISHKAKKTKEDHAVSARSRKNFLGVILSLGLAKRLYVGGGTLLQKETSKRSFYYYACLIALAKRFGKQVVYYANGLGDFNEKEQPTVAKLLQGKCVVILRDKVSYEFAQKLVATMPQRQKPYLALAADSAFLLPSLLKEERKSLLNLHGLPCDTPYFVLALSGREPNASLDEGILSLMQMANELGFRPVFLVMQPTVDNRRAKSLASRYERQSAQKPLILSLSPQGALALVEEAAFLVTSRFHPLVFAALGGKPAICLSQSEKTKRLAEEVFSGDILLSSLDAETLLYLFPRLVASLGNPSSAFHPRAEVVSDMVALAAKTPEFVLEGFSYLAQRDKTTHEK